LFGVACPSPLLGGDVSKIIALPGGEQWQVGDTQFVYSFNKRLSSAARLSIQKPADLVERYVEICKTFQHGAIVELGIAGGGSTALISLLAEPRKLVACELNEQPVQALTEFIDAHGATDVVRPFYGVDQSDSVRIAEIVDAEFAGRPLDLVIDDASHLYAETASSFDVLFPRLRAGGLLIIEDWTIDHYGAKWVLTVMSDRDAPEFADRERRLTEALVKKEQGVGRKPLHGLALELIQASVDSSDVVGAVTIDKHWIVVRRGPAELDPSTFHLADHYSPDTWGWT
jgi:predicted O-methyltransferase YrrM